jgi:uncharacterized FlaG/YvyC family protein
VSFTPLQWVALKLTTSFNSNTDAPFDTCASTLKNSDRASGEQLAQMSEEISEMFASLDDPAQYLIHDMRFDQTIVAKPRVWR